MIPDATNATRTDDRLLDVVYFWVDGADPVWRARRDEWFRRHGLALPDEARFRTFDELRYSLRSLTRHLRGLGNVFLVTDGQRPAWLGDHPRLRVVDHAEIFAHPEDLPTWSSRALEANVHRVPGLRERFLLLCDDYFLVRAAGPEDFVESATGRLVYGLEPFVRRRWPRRSGDLYVAGVENAFAAIERRWGRFLRPFHDSLRNRILAAIPALTHPFNAPAHRAHVFSRAQCAGAEEAFPQDHRRTSGEHVRTPAGVEVHSLRILHALHEGLAIARPDTTSLFLYNDQPQAHWHAVERALLAGTSPATHLCLNDGARDPAVAEAWADLLARLLPALFPEPSPFERPAAE